MTTKRQKDCALTSAFQRLNKACRLLEHRLKQTIIKTNALLLAKVKGNKSDFVHDFCISVTIGFYLDHLHPEWIAGETSLVGSVILNGNMFPPYDSGDWSHLADKRDWNPNTSCKCYPFTDKDHCYIISKLITQLDASKLKLLEHISDICTDVQVSLHHTVAMNGTPYQSEKIDWPPISVKSRKRKGCS